MQMLRAERASSGVVPVAVLSLPLPPSDDEEAGEELEEGEEEGEEEASEGTGRAEEKPQLTAAEMDSLDYTASSERLVPSAPLTVAQAASASASTRALRGSGARAAGGGRAEPAQAQAQAPEGDEDEPLAYTTRIFRSQQRSSGRRAASPVPVAVQGTASSLPWRLSVAGSKAPPPPGSATSSSSSSTRSSGSAGGAAAAAAAAANPGAATKAKGEGISVEERAVVDGATPFQGLQRDFLQKRRGSLG